jgi:hypothetical protein
MLPSRADCRRAGTSWAPLRFERNSEAVGLPARKWARPGWLRLLAACRRGLAWCRALDAASATQPLRGRATPVSAPHLTHVRHAAAAATLESPLDRSPPDAPVLYTPHTPFPTPLPPLQTVTAPVCLDPEPLHGGQVFSPPVVVVVGHVTRRIALRLATFLGLGVGGG